MNTLNQRKSNGFTIIEVVLVIAIAGLIILMAIIAFPTLARNQRDVQRRSDVARVISQVANYQTNARGSVPSTSTALTTFANSYLLNAGDFKDPKSGSAYTFNFAATAPDTTGVINFRSSKVCSTDGTTMEDSTSNRNVAVLTLLEGSGVYCQDNR